MQRTEELGTPGSVAGGGKWQLAPEQARRGSRENPVGLLHGLLGRRDLFAQEDQLGIVAGAQSCGFRETGLRKKAKEKAARGQKRPEALPKKRRLSWTWALGPLACRLSYSESEN